MNENTPAPISTAPVAAKTLDGKLTREERVLIAQDVIKVLNSRQRKFVLASTYLEARDLPTSGPLNSVSIKGECFVCARGMMFIKALDRFNQFNMKKYEAAELQCAIANRTEVDWGLEQCDLMENIFEGFRLGPTTGVDIKQLRKDWGYTVINRKKLMISICQNIIDNNGELVVPEKYYLQEEIVEELAK